MSCHLHFKTFYGRKEIDEIPPSTSKVRCNGNSDHTEFFRVLGKKMTLEMSCYTSEGKEKNSEHRKTRLIASYNNGEISNKSPWSHPFSLQSIRSKIFS